MSILYTHPLRLLKKPTTFSVHQRALGRLCPTVRHRRRRAAATAYGRTALSGRDVATRRRHRAASAAAAGAATSRIFIVDRPLTFVTVM